MPIFASNFASNSLSGVTTVIAGNVTINLTPAAFALEGDRTFVVKLRKGSSQAAVIATSPVVTIKDRTNFVSLTANTATVNEGNLVAFSLVTANVLDGVTVYYSVFPATANVTADDFTSNTGSVVITNNAATFALQANVNIAPVDETGENFRVQLRTNSPTGNIVYTTSNVTILDTYKTYNVLTFAPTEVTSLENSNVTFTFSATNVPLGTVLFYETAGNATVTSNTGSFVLNSLSNTFTVSAGAVPGDSVRAFTVNLRAGASNAPIVATSSSAYVLDTALAYMSATGGNEVYTIGGYRVHKFLSSNNFTITRSGATPTLSNIEYLVIAGGGAGGQSGSGGSTSAGGGGAGGYLRANSYSVLGQSLITVTVGGGGAGWGGPIYTAPSINPGSNSSISPTIVAFGGGGGGLYQGGAPGDGTNAYGRPGGSGGGGNLRTTPPPGGGNPGAPGGSGVPGQGYPGGTGSTYYGSGFVGGGGGGAGGAGGNGSTGPGAPSGAAGGAGAFTDISGTNTLYAKGGSSPTGAYYAGNVNTGNGADGGLYENLSGGSGIVIIRYPFVDSPTYTSLTTSSTFIYESANAVFTLNTLNLANNTLLYYTTVGNVISSDFVSGNTGSFRSTANATTISLATNSNIPANQERFFQLQVRSEGLTESVVATSNVFTIKDTALNPMPSTVEYLVVAGGGGGGGAGGGGGGAGGYRTATGYSVSSGSTITVTVGAGGYAGVATLYGNGYAGSDSVFGSITSSGGGGGATEGVVAGSGGSGGGSGVQSNGANRQGSGTVGQGNNGGNGGNPGGGGGGGGAGAVGVTATNNNGAAGGDGLQSSISGTATYYAGGGGGASYNNPGTGGAGGNGGGGAGRGLSNQIGENGSSNTGGGGGGGSKTTAQYGGTGGSGIVIIRYPDTFIAATSTTGSPTITVAGGYRVYKWTSSGSITF